MPLAAAPFDRFRSPVYATYTTCNLPFSRNSLGSS
jgi:hypothetical protein